MTVKLLYIVGTFISAAQIRCCCWQALGSGGQPVWSNSANLVLPQFPYLTEPAALAPWEEGRRCGSPRAGARWCLLIQRVNALGLPRECWGLGTCSSSYCIACTGSSILAAYLFSPS